MKEITLPDSGKTIKVKRLARFLVREAMRDLQRKYPEPRPPRQPVDYGAGPEWEENYSHPDYLEAMKRHERKLKDLTGQLSLELVIARCVVVEVDAEAVKALREDMRAVNIDLSPDDKYVYVTCILCETERDLKALQEGVLLDSQPTPEGIAAAQKSFPSES